MPKPGDGSGDRFLLLIALERSLRGVLLLIAGIFLLANAGADFGSIANHLARAIELDPRRHFIKDLIAKAGSLKRHEVKLFGAGAIGYGVLELVEGVGLFYRQRWAEWLTVVATSLLIPLELYEEARHPGPLKAAGIAVNIAIVVYLFRIVHRKGHG